MTVGTSVILVIQCWRLRWHVWRLRGRHLDWWGRGGAWCREPRCGSIRCCSVSGNDDPMRASALGRATAKIIHLRWQGFPEGDGAGRRSVPGLPGTSPKTDRRIGPNAARTTLGAVAQLAQASLRKW